MRFGIAINSQKFKIDKDLPYYINDFDDNGVISFVPTYDYYFNDNKYHPYLGLGFGYYLFNDIDISDRKNSSSDISDGKVKNQFDFLLRGGFELGNMRCGLEYNFMPKADIKTPNEQAMGSIDNSYLGLSIGFMFGARKTSI